MQLFVKLFSSWIQFVYHTFDRVVINGYLDFFRAEGHVVEFFHKVVKEPGTGSVLEIGYKRCVFGGLKLRAP